MYSSIPYFTAALLALCAAIAPTSIGSVSEDKLVASLPESRLPELEELLRIAMTESNTMKARLMQEGRQDGVRIAARSALLPSVSANYSARSEERMNVPGTDWNSRVISSFAIRQPIYHWGALKQNKDVGKLIYASEVANSLRAFQTLSNVIRSDFLSLSIKKQQLELARAARELNRRSIEISRELRETGLESAASVGLKELNWDISEIEFDKKVLEYENALYELARLIGVNESQLESSLAQTVETADVLSVEEIAALGQQVHIGLAASIDMRNLERGIQIAEKRLRIQKKRLWPKLNLSLGTTQNERDVNGRISEDELAYAGMSASWSIFDGLRNDGLKMTALHDLEIAENNARLYREGFTHRLLQAARTLEFAARNLGIEERRLAMERGAWNKVKEDFESKTATQIQLEQAKQRLDNSFVRVQIARRNYLDPLSQLVGLLGLDPIANAYATLTEAE